MGSLFTKGYFMIPCRIFESCGHSVGLLGDYRRCLQTTVFSRPMGLWAGVHERLIMKLAKNNTFEGSPEAPSRNPENSHFLERQKK